MLTGKHNSKHKRHFVIRCHWVQGSRHSEATCTPDSQSQMSLQSSNTTSGTISRCDAATSMWHPPNREASCLCWQGLIHVRSKWSWQRSAPVFTVPSVTVNGTTCTPSYMTPNQLHHKAHNNLPLQSMQPTQQYVSNIRTCSTVLCSGTEKLTASRREVSCGEAYEQRCWIWHQHCRKAEHVFRQWKTRTQRYILQETPIVWEGVPLTRCQQPQHSDNLHRTLHI